MWARPGPAVSLTRSELARGSQVYLNLIKLNYAYSFKSPGAHSLPLPLSEWHSLAVAVGAALPGKAEPSAAVTGRAETGLHLRLGLQVARVLGRDAGMGTECASLNAISGGARCGRGSVHVSFGNLTFNLNEPPWQCGSYPESRSGLPVPRSLGTRSRRILSRRCELEWANLRLWQGTGTGHRAGGGLCLTLAHSVHTSESGCQHERHTEPR